MSWITPMVIYADRKAYQDSIGGRKSVHHIKGQDRLERIFAGFFNTEQESELPTLKKTYYSDVLLTVGVIDPKRFACLEVDTYKYGSQKKKSPKHIKERDNAIMQFYHIPVIRIDVDALKEGRSQTKYYQSDKEIFDYVLDKEKSFKLDPEKYMQEAQRG